jgi:hypothetical protein
MKLLGANVLLYAYNSDSVAGARSNSASELDLG